MAGPLGEQVGASTALVLFAIVSTVPSLLVLAFPAVRAITRRDRPVDDDAPSALAEAPEPEARLATA